MSLMYEIARRNAAFEAEAAAAEQEAPADESEIDPERVLDALKDAPESDEDETADAAEVAEYCGANGCPSLAASLIREKATMKQVRARVDAAGTIRAIVADAATITDQITSEMAGQYIAAGLSVEQVRAKVWNAVCDAQSEEIRSAIAADAGVDVEARKSDGAMAAAIDRVNARFAQALGAPTEREG